MAISWQVGEAERRVLLDDFAAVRVRVSVRVSVRVRVRIRVRSTATLTRSTATLTLNLTRPTCAICPPSRVAWTASPTTSRACAGGSSPCSSSRWSEPHCPLSGWGGVKSGWRVAAAGAGTRRRWRGGSIVGDKHLAGIYHR